MREKLRNWLEQPWVGRAVIGVILFNAVILGIETSKPVMERAGGLIHLLDRICLAIFTAELAAKLIAYGPRFFRSGWNVFDFAIVAVSLAPGAQTLSVLRALRILRVLRVISIMPRLRRVVEGFITALPGMGSVFLLMGIVFYVGSVMATKLFGESFPELFGSLGASAFSLFQIMTLEGWAGEIVRPVMDAYPQAWLFFIPFILLTTFAVVNLLVGLIVNSMQEANAGEEEAEEEAWRRQLLARLDQIERRVSETRR
jgi:voltage-gated sodium channel